MDLGKKIREIREDRNMSIKELAEKLKVSNSHISQVERNISSPSITMLKNIANVFEIPMTSFFDDIETKSTVIRRKERKKIMLPDSNFAYEMLSPSSVTEFQFLLTRIEEGGKLGENPVGHKGQECCFISKGQVEFTIKDTVYQLEEGDSIYYPENTPHNVVNSGKGEAIIISVINPASF